MYYTVIDPPVTAFSRPEEISAWIRELRSRASRPEFQYPENRGRLDEAIEEAEQWYAESRTLHGPDRGADSEPNRPAV